MILAITFKKVIKKSFYFPETRTGHGNIIIFLQKLMRFAADATKYQIKIQFQYNRAFFLISASVVF